MGIIDSATKKAKETINTSVSEEVVTKMANSIFTIEQKINREKGQNKLESMQKKRDEIKKGFIKKKDELLSDLQKRNSNDSSNHLFLIMTRENIQKTLLYRNDYYEHTDFELAFYDKDNFLRYRAVGLNDREKQTITVYDFKDIEVGLVKEKRIAWRKPSLITEYEPVDFDLYARDYHLGKVRTSPIVKGSMMEVSFNGWHLKWKPGGCFIVDSKNEFIASISIKISDWSKQYLLEYLDSIDPVLIVLLAVVVKARDSHRDRESLRRMNSHTGALPDE